MQNSNLADGFVDLNVVYEKRRHENAVKIRHQEEVAKQEAIKLREEAKKFEDFKAKVKGDDSGLTLLDLKNMNSVYKREYVKIIMADEEVTRVVLSNMDHKADEMLDECVDLEHGIEDTKDVWDKSVNAINHAINEAAIKNGIKEK